MHIDVQHSALAERLSSRQYRDDVTGNAPSKFGDEFVISDFVREVIAAGCSKIVFEKRVDLTRPDIDDVVALGVIRELTSHCIKALWTSVPLSERQQIPFVHLAPPRPRGDIRDEGLHSLWRSRHIYGLCFWRHGPGFLKIKDARGDNEMSYTLSSPAYMGPFLQCQTPILKSDVACSELDTLIQDGLIGEFGDYVLTLPYRIRSWPVPCSAL